MLTLRKWPWVALVPAWRTLTDGSGLLYSEAHTIPARTTVHRTRRRRGAGRGPNATARRQRAVAVARWLSHPKLTPAATSVPAR